MKRETRSDTTHITGLKRTPQRMAILEFLEGNTSHPSAEEVYRAVSKKYPSMSFATVYNTLNALVKHGAVRDLSIDPERRRFDPNTTPHHHLVCLGCKKIVDVWDELDVSLPRSSAKEFTVVGNHIEFYGYCSRCSRKQK